MTGQASSWPVAHEHCLKPRQLRLRILLASCLPVEDAAQANLSDQSTRSGRRIAPSCQSLESIRCRSRPLRTRSTSRSASSAVSASCSPMVRRQGSEVRKGLQRRSLFRPANIPVAAAYMDRGRSTAACRRQRPGTSRLVRQVSRFINHRPMPLSGDHAPISSSHKNIFTAACKHQWIRG